MELLERDETLIALAALLEEAASGTGRLVFVSGEAGVGKTSLARAFTEQHRDRVRVWWGACDALSTPRPLGPVHDIARTEGGELASLMAEDASRHARFTAFLDALASPLSPTLAVIEDVHWADEATRDLLLFLARRVNSTNALVLATYRDDEVGAQHPLRRVLGSVATQPGVQRLSLARLSERAVARLAEGRDADPAQLYRVTGGNPFFVTEVLATAERRVPETVSDAVLARVQRLSARAREVVETAAVVPDRVEFDLLRTVTGCEPEVIEECTDAATLQADGAWLRFRHELARLAVEGSIPEWRRVPLHAAVLAYLTEDTDAEPARLAYHADEAGDRAAVLTHAPIAAEQAARLGAHREAAAQYERALRHADALAGASRAELWERYADECTAIDREAEALAAYDEALAHWREVAEVERVAAVLARRAYVLWGSGQNERARASAEEAVTLLETRPAGPALATVYTYDAHLRMLAREIPEALEQGRRAVEVAEEHGDPALLARALNIVGAAQWFADPDEAEVTLARALETARRSGDDTIVGIVMRMLGSGGGEVRRYRLADQWLREGVRWCAEHDLDIHGDYCLAWLARSCFEQGRWSEADDVLADALGRSSEHAPTGIVALTALGRLRTRRGDPGAEPPLAEAWEIATTTGDLQRLWPVAAGRAEGAWLTGRADDIPDLVGETYALALRREHDWAIGELAFWLWTAGQLDHAPARAAAPYKLQIAGDWRGAAEAWERIGCPYEVAVALGDADDPDAVRRAVEILARLGAAPMADRLAAKLRALGVHDVPRRPRRATLANPGGLTGRQLEVLALLAEDKRNSEIAAALHLSPKTVGHHVSAILERLGVPDRREAARLARKQGLTGD